MSDYDFRLDELIALHGRIEALLRDLAGIKRLADDAQRYDWDWALERISDMAAAALDGEEGVGDE